MLSIVVSVLAALLTAAAVYPLFGTWYAPIPPALLVGGLTFYLLVRTFSKRVEAAMMPLMQVLQDPAVPQEQKVGRAEAILDDVVKRYAKWVLLLDGQLSVQKGMLRYAQMKWDEAKPLLERGQWNNWQAHVALGAIAYRSGDKETCWTHMEKAAKAASKESMIYVIWAVLAKRSGDQERALKALGLGLEKKPDSKVLKDLRQRIANKKRIDVKQLPQTWYHFFPEDLMKQMMVRGRKGKMELPPGVQGRYQQPAFPQPKGVSKKMRRG